MKTVIITGVSRGLGRATAEAFAADGWRVLGTGRSDRPTTLADVISYYQFDASDSAATEDFWAGLRLEEDVCLVNNAGGYIGGSLAELKPNDYANQMQSNYFAAVNMTRGLVQATPKARIINIVSGSALVVRPKDSAYGASKAALKHFFQSVQKEYSPTQYQFTNLYPNMIATQGPNPDGIKPQDLAALILQLADASASYYLSDITIRSI